MKTKIETYNYDARFKRFVLKEKGTHDARIGKSVVKRHTKAKRSIFSGMSLKQKAYIAIALLILGWFVTTLRVQGHPFAQAPATVAQASDETHLQTNMPKDYVSADMPANYDLFDTYFKENADVMRAICQAESGMNDNAVHKNKNGSLDQGRCQINTINVKYYVGQNIFDPEVNIATAYKVYQSQGFTAWTCFKNGSYKKYL